MAELDSATAEAQFEQVRHRMSDKNVSLKVVLDKSLGTALRGMAELDRGVTGLTGSITRHTATVGASTLKYAALAGALAQAISLVGGLASAAATASGSLLVLPAVGIAAAVAVQTLKLGVDGLSDALKADTPEKYAKAVKDFPPAMRATSDAVRALKPEFDGLKLDVQTALFADLSGEVTKLGGTYLPVLRGGLSEVAAGFNVGARGVGEFGREGQTVDDVRLILDNTGQSVRYLSGGFAPLLRALRDIAAVGSDFLPGFASGLADGADTFSQFIATARETGQLRQWMSAGLSALGDLFTLLSNLVKIVATVFAAADQGGAGLLGTLNAVTGGLLAFLRSAEGTVALQQIFGGLGAVAGALLPLVMSIASVLASDVAPAIALLGPMVAAALGVLTGAAAPLGTILGALAPLVGTAAQALASVLVPVLTLLSGVVAELAPAVSLVVHELVGGALADGVRELSPALLALARAAAPIIVQLGQLLVDALRVAAPALSALLTVLTPIASELAGSLLTALAAVLPLVGQLAGVFSAVLLAALQAVMPVLPVVVDVVEQLADVLSVGLAAATPSLIETGRLLGEVLTTALVGLLPLLPPLAEAWMRIWSEGLVPLLPVLLELVSALLPPAVELITKLLPLVLQAAGLLATWTAAIAKVAAAFTEGLIPVLLFLIDNVVVPVFDKIVSVVSGALQALQGGLDLFIGIFTGDWDRAWTGAKDLVIGAFRSIASGIDLATGGLLSYVAGLPGRIIGALGNVGSLLLQVGKDIINGLLRGIESMFQTVKNRLAQLTNLLPSWKGPPARDRTLLRANGVLLMRGLVTGLEDGEPAVRNYLSDLTRRLPLTLERSTVDITRSGARTFGATESTSTEQPVTAADLAAFTDAVRELAARPVVVQVGTTEIARATAEGNRVLSRR
ncbi:hypothetical protein [Umezawaea sp. Da 62-37]|uniref:phage tail protein n=1 Tax=Umezawaea sp. Da 62-37 TaxID=3075927 RepID=UPI0028F6C3E7|nr:hypothetical protein [Umezawaea sp. Da 62-37]WNV82209.1 hypothetical protein RM788_28825 [Umezawaea sp. Da 62-37]